MSRPFAVFDIDGTLIRWQLYHAIVTQLAKRGTLDAVSYENVRQARMLWKKRTRDEAFKDYERYLVKVYDQLLAKLSVQEFDEAAAAVFNEYKDQAYTYTRELIGALKKHNYLLFAISSSQAEIVAKIAKYYGFDDWSGTVYPQQGDYFTGQKEGFFGTKHIVLQAMIDRHAAQQQGSIGVGDTESDVSLLEMVKRPIAFNPNKKLFEVARQKHWKIVIERKNVIYELEAKNGSYLLA